MRNVVAKTEAHYDATTATPPAKAIQAGAIQLYGGVISSSVTNVPYPCLHSFSTEMYAQCLRAIEMMWLRKALPEIGVEIHGPTAINGDNQSVITMSQPGACPTKSKMDMTRIAIMQEATRGGEGAALAPNKVHTDINFVDFMTKHSPPKKQIMSVRMLQNITNAVPPARTIDDMIRIALETSKTENDDTSRS